MSLGWRIRAEKPFAAFIGYRCQGTKAQSAGGGQNRILVQGLKGFEEYGHEVRAKKWPPYDSCGGKSCGWVACTKITSLDHGLGYPFPLFWLMGLKVVVDVSCIRYS